VLLREELGTSPGPALARLHEELLRGEARVAASPPPSPAELVEREREVATLRRPVGDAAAGQGGIALIEGPAGVGKSRLLAVARREAGAAGLRPLLGRGTWRRATRWPRALTPA